VSLYRLSGLISPAVPTVFADDDEPGFTLAREDTPPGGTLSLRDRGGAERYRIEPPAVRLRDCITVTSGTDVAAIVRKVLEAPLREQFRIDVLAGGSWTALGRIAAREYTIKAGTDLVAKVIPSPGCVADGCDVQIALTDDPGLVLMVAIAIDELTRPRAS
jgi:uncharacterized protein YxjI